MQLSFWEKDTYFGNIDVLIVGSGIVGLNAALHLKNTQPQLKVVVVERCLLPALKMPVSPALAAPRSYWKIWNATRRRMFLTWWNADGRDCNACART